MKQVWITKQNMFCLKRAFISLILLGIFASCNPNPGIGGSSTTATGGGSSGPGDQRPTVVSSVSIANDRIYINGTRMDHTTGVQLTGPNSFNETLVLEAASESQLVAKFQRQAKLFLDHTFNLIISGAYGAQTFIVTVNLGGTSGISLKGTWVASTNTPTLDDSDCPGAVSGGDYYIATDSGSDANVASGVTFNAGDWVLCDSTVGVYKKIELGSAGVSSFNTRTGAVTPTAGDYAASGLSDVTITGIATGEGLIWNGSAFTDQAVLLDANGSVGNSNIAVNAVTATEIADDAVTLDKLVNITQGSILQGGASAAPTELAAGTSGKILVGDGTDLASVAVSGDATLAAGGALTLVNASVTGQAITGFSSGAGTVAATDTILQAIQKLDGNSFSSTLTSAKIFVGNGSNVATGVAMSGDITIDNTGATSIGTGKVTSDDLVDDGIVNADVNSAAAIDGSKLANTASGNISSTTVQTAIDELDSEKLALSGGTMTGAISMGANNINGTGTVSAGAFVSAGAIRFTETGGGANFNSFTSPSSLAGDVTYTFPTAAPGTNGDVLSSTTAGVLSWATIVSSGDSAGGELNGTYPNPTIADSTIDSANIINDSIINVDVNSSAAIARSKLGTGTNDHVVINSGTGTFSSEATLALSRGGTAASTAGAARTSLGLAIGSNVQAYSSELDEIVALNSSTDSTFIVGSGAGWVQENATTARASLGVGTVDSPSFTGLTLSGLVSCDAIDEALGTNGSGVLSCVAPHTSDARLKSILGDYEDGLDEILRLRPKRYIWNGIDGKRKDKKEYGGFIAQNVREFMPLAVGENKEGYLHLRIVSIIAALVNATQEQQNRIELNKTMYFIMQGKWVELEGRVSEHDREIASLKDEVKMLKDYICKKDPEASICK